MADHEQPPNTPHGQGPTGGAYPDGTGGGVMADELFTAIELYSATEAERIRRDVTAYVRGEMDEPALMARGYTALYVLGIKHAAHVARGICEAEHTLSAEESARYVASVEPDDPGPTLTARQAAALQADQIERSRRLNAADPVTDERWATSWTPCASEEGE